MARRLITAPDSMPQAATKRVWAVFFPGGLLLLAVAFLFVALGPHAERALTIVSYVSCSIFSAGLLLSAIFQRSRVFFILLILGIADLAVTFAAPQLKPVAQQCLLDSAVLLLSVNIVLLASAHDRGIITPWGRWQMTVIALQAAGVLLICGAAPEAIERLLGHTWLSPVLLSQGRISQLPLAAISLALAIMLAREWKRRTAVGSGML